MNLRSLILRRRFHKEDNGGVLPIGYRRLPYVTCDSSYIDSGVYGDFNTRVDCHFMLTSRYPIGSGLFGSYGESGPHTLRVNFTSPTASQTDMAQFYSNEFRLTDNFPLNKECRISMNRYGLRGSRSHGWYQTRGTTVSTIYVGGINITGFDSYIRGFAGRLYGCDIYYMDTLQRSYVPAYSEADDKYGLYDTVNNTFSESIGDNPFYG